MFKIYVRILISHSLSLRTSVKGEIERKYSKSNFFPNFDLSGAWRSAISTAK